MVLRDQNAFVPSWTAISFHWVSRKIQKNFRSLRGCRLRHEIYTIATAFLCRLCVLNHDLRDHDQHNMITILNYHEYAELRIPFKTIQRIEVVGSCNGLVCSTCDYMGNIILWNPFIRKSMILPKPRTNEYNHNQDDDQRFTACARVGIWLRFSNKWL